MGMGKIFLKVRLRKLASLSPICVRTLAAVYAKTNNHNFLIQDDCASTETCHRDKAAPLVLYGTNSLRF